jgi:WD40 repeat protein
MQVTCLARHPKKEDTYAVGYSDGSIRLWSVSLPERGSSSMAHMDVVVPNGLGGTVRGARCTVTLQGHKSAISSLVFKYVTMNWCGYFMRALL